MENRAEKQYNQRQDSAQLEAQLEHATRSKEQVDLEKAFVKSKVDVLERVQKFYQEIMKKEKCTQQNTIKWGNFILSISKHICTNLLVKHNPKQ